MRWLKSLVRTLNTWQVEALLVLLAMVIVLRIPNLIEPYWYGDEAIYLTIGNALRHGSRLYLDIIDHKTPLIYYLAMVPTQFSFRLLFLGWMLATTASFYYLALRLLKNLPAAIVATTAFILLTTLPWLEGNIPNGELFMMGFVLLGAAIASQTSAFARWLDEPLAASPLSRINQNLLLLVSGLFFGLGILTKVPALFDLVGWLSLGWFGVMKTVWKQPKRTWVPDIEDFLHYVPLLSIGAILTVMVSILYFVVRGSGQAYLDYGLLYNFRYVGSWAPSFNPPWLAVWFTLLGKAAVTTVIGLLLTFLTRWIKPKYSFIVFWFVVAIFAATLSNRPYPHYLLQVVPPLALCLGWLALAGQSFIKTKRLVPLFSPVILTALPMVMLIITWVALGFFGYPAISYYANFIKVMTGQVSSQTYAEGFNSSIGDNTRVTEILQTSQSPSFFIWGTNPLLYAQSHTIPSSRFTVAFHIKDFNAYDETLAQVKAKQPEYIVVMKDDAQTFPALNQYLLQHYMSNTSFETMVLWKRWN